MEEIKEVRRNGDIIHFGVGAIIESDGKYLLIDRAIKPYGIACVAGHQNEGESIEEALKREVKEEVGLDIERYRLFFSGKLENNLCVKGANVHYWYIFRCDVKGDIKINSKEVISARWYSADSIKKLRLEDSRERLFKELGVTD